MLTTALLEEVRASTSVGGGGREKAEPEVEAGSASGTWSRRDAAEELGKSPERYANGSPIPRVREGPDKNTGRKASGKKRN